MILFIWIQKQAKLFYGFNVGIAVNQVEAVVGKENTRSTFFTLGAVLSLWNWNWAICFSANKMFFNKIILQKTTAKKKKKPKQNKIIFSHA